MCKGTAAPSLHAPVRAVSLKPIVAHVAQLRLTPLLPIHGCPVLQTNIPAAWAPAASCHYRGAETVQHDACSHAVLC